MWGLKVNIGETEYTIIGVQGRDLITETETIKNVDECKYILVILASDGRQWKRKTYF